MNKELPTISIMYRQRSSFSSSSKTMSHSSHSHPPHSFSRSRSPVRNSYESRFALIAEDMERLHDTIKMQHDFVMKRCSHLEGAFSQLQQKQQRMEIIGNMEIEDRDQDRTSALSSEQIELLEKADGRFDDLDRRVSSLKDYLGDLTKKISRLNELGQVEVNKQQEQIRHLETENSTQKVCIQELKELVERMQRDWETVQQRLDSVESYRESQVGQQLGHQHSEERMQTRTNRKDRDCHSYIPWLEIVKEVYGLPSNTRAKAITVKSTKSKRVLIGRLVQNCGYFVPTGKRTNVDITGNSHSMRIREDVKPLFVSALLAKCPSVRVGGRVYLPV